MAKQNTLAQLEFFKTIQTEEVDRLKSMVAADSSLLDAFDYRNFGATPLTAACFSGRMQSVSALIELGADPNKRSDWSMGPWSPLHCAIFRRNQPLAEYLLDQGAAMDVHTAAGLGRLPDVSRLIEADPTRVNERGGDGCQPLHFADSVDVAELLLTLGADIDGRCIDHYSTPAQYLCSCRPEVARYLFFMGATPDIFSAVLCGDQTVLEELLVADPDLIHARMNQKVYPPSHEHDVHNILTFIVGSDATPLHAAAMSEHHETIPILVRGGLSANVRGGYDQGTPLHTAAWHNRAAAARSLLDSGADMEARSGRLHNNTPAGWAIVAGADLVFRLLLDRGAVRHPWFIDDARDACAGRFDAVSNSSPEQRARIHAWLSELAF